MNTTGNVEVIYAPLAVSTVGLPLDISLKPYLFRSKDRFGPKVAR